MVPIETDPFKFRLCYVDRFAWFTSVPLEHQWGDDWDDIPYEHNAGIPYDTHYDSPFVKGGTDRKRVEHPLVKVAWSSEHELPCDNQINSCWSVQKINSGNVAWFLQSRYSENDALRPIQAGTSLEDFVRIIKEGGGEVYLPTDLIQSYNEIFKERKQHEG